MQGQCCRGQTNVAIWSWLLYTNECVGFFSFAMKTDKFLTFVNLQLDLHHIRTKLYSLPLKRLHALYESTLTLHFTVVRSPGHRLHGIISDISSNRFIKAVGVSEPTETRNRPFLNVKFANKGIDALNFSNILNRKSVQNEITRYFQYKKSPCISYSYTRSVAS